MNLSNIENPTPIPQLLDIQRNYFRSGKTLDVDFRIQCLKNLRSTILEHQSDIEDALNKDLRKTGFETYMTEIGMVLDEIRYHLKCIKKWTKIRKVKTPLSQFPAKSYVVPQPYGVALIISPWNYPFQLCLEPLVGAISAGNTAILKPSAYAPSTSACIAKLISQVFDPGHVSVVQGGRAENQALLDQKFDYIFFTGSVGVGKEVMCKAAAHLTPVSLELGGKSPVIIDSTADLEIAARRLAFGKVLNAGQTCVAPDYLLIQQGLKDKFLPLLLKEIQAFFPNGDYSDSPVIVNDKHFSRLRTLIDDTLHLGARAYLAPHFDPDTRLITPTILDNLDFSSPIMGEEIFGPILPVIEFPDLDWAISQILQRPSPLALYLFSNNPKVQERILHTIPFGGGCINDTIIHLATPHMGFGGVGESGMGSYHGQKSFDTFTHYKSIVHKSNLLDLPMRYHPYTQRNLSIIKHFLK